MNERYVERERERGGRGRQEGEGRERGIDIGPNSPQLLFQIIRNTLTNTSIIGSIVMEFCITSVYVTLIFSLCTTLVTVIGTVSGYNVTQLVYICFELFFLKIYLTVAITFVSKMNTRENITASMMDTIFYHSILYLRLFTVLYSFHAVTFLAISIENQ